MRIDVDPDSVRTSRDAVYAVMCNARNPCSGAYSIIAGSGSYYSVQTAYSMLEPCAYPWSQTGPLRVVEAVEG